MMCEYLQPSAGLVSLVETPLCCQGQAANCALERAAPRCKQLRTDTQPGFSKKQNKNLSPKRGGGASFFILYRTIASYIVYVQDVQYDTTAIYTTDGVSPPHLTDFHLLFVTCHPLLSHWNTKDQTRLVLVVLLLSLHPASSTRNTNTTQQLPPWVIWYRRDIIRINVYC